MSRKARRAFARSLGRGPFRPEQLGALAFSVALVAFGAAALALTAPSVLQQEILARQATVMSFADAAGAAALNAGSSDAAPDGEGAVGEGTEGDSSSDAAGTDGGPGSGGAVLFPGIEFPTVDSVAHGGSSGDDGSSNDESGSGSGSNAGSGSGSGSGSSGSDGSGSGSDGGSSENSSGISEAQEQAYLSYLRQCYDALPPYQEALAQAYADFPTLALEPSRDTRNAYWAAEIKIRDSIDIALMSMMDNSPPEASRYYDDYMNIRTLYEDLSSAAGILARAWASNLQFDDPAAHEYYWMGPIRDNTSGGKLTFFADYEARYPGARP